MRLLLLCSFFVPSFCIQGKLLNGGTVSGLLGIPYAERTPHRLKESQLVGTFEETAEYSRWPNRCITERTDGAEAEDCLYLSVLRHSDGPNQTAVFLYITNEELSETKLADLVNDELSIVVAHAREGAFASFDGHVYSTSDIENIFKFVSNERSRFGFGEVTVLAEDRLAEAVSLVLDKIDAKRAILFGGNALTRTAGREKFGRRAAHGLLRSSGCDLPSEAQSFDCLRALSTEEYLEHVRRVKASFYPFGDPFRVPPNRKVSNSQIPTLYGIYKSEAPQAYGYPATANFTSEYTYMTFKKFLAGLIPDSKFANGPLLRRLALHQFVHSKGPKTDTFFLFEQMRKMLYDRDFVSPTHKLVMHLANFKKNMIWLFEYAIDNPPKNCFQDGGWEDIAPFCKRLVEYYTRLAAKGSPTDQGCSAENPTFPAMKKAKRDYFVRIQADGKPDWEFNFHQEEVVFWNDLIPAMDRLELAGRRDAVFPEEQEISAIEEEDDLQLWHEQAADRDKEEPSEEKILNDMPFRGEL